MKKTTVLIVEDDPIVAGDIERSVQKLGYEVVGTAATGQEAIALAKANSPAVVLTDITLKGPVDGIMAASVITAQTNTAVIYLTAHSDAATFERAKITEPYGYIVKPFSETDLRITIGLALYKREKGEVRMPSLAPVPTEQAKIGGAKSKESDVKRRFLRGLELFASLSEAEREEFASHCRVITSKTGEVVVSEGGNQEACYIVIEGRASMFKSSPNGREFVVEILAPKDLSSLIAAFDDEFSAATIKAVAKSSILLVPKKVLFELLNRHPEFYKLFTQKASQRIRAAYNIMRAMAHDKVEARIASMLTELSKRTALCEKPGEIKITRQELADLTGTTPETAIRVTRAMEDQGILELSKRGIIAIKNLAQLKDSIGAFNAA